MAWQCFPIDNPLRKSLLKRLRNQPPIFNFESDPMLASLVASMGIQFEMGNPEMDRLSAPLRILLDHFPQNPWQSEIISYGNQIGVRLWIPGLKEFIPDHRDFHRILHPLSLDSQGRLSQIVIFPLHVVENFKKVGLELVIVRDWAISAFLEEKDNVNYFVTNDWEIETNSGLMQTTLMARGQLAFSGTHDIGDHLLGYDKKSFFQSHDFFKKVEDVFETIFGENKKPKNSQLIFSYLIGILMDDLAQPVWYNSPGHIQAIEVGLEKLMATQGFDGDFPNLKTPPGFFEFISKLRNTGAMPQELPHFLKDPRPGNFFNPNF